MAVPGTELVERLRRAGVTRGSLVALAVAPGVGLGLSVPNGDEPDPGGDGFDGDLCSVSVSVDHPVGLVTGIEEALRPRWVVWSSTTTASLVGDGLRVATGWDVAAVHRLLFGGWRCNPDRVWAQLHDLALDRLPSAGPADLFGGAGGDPDDPIRPDGYLRPEWVSGGWSHTPARLARWAQLAGRAAVAQQGRLGRIDRPAAASTARSQSAVELLCVEMATDGLPMDRAAAEAVIGEVVGPRPRTAAEAAERRAARDAEVLRHAPSPVEADLRSPGQVKTLLARVGVDVPDTRAARLRALQGTHPLVDALLVWRKAERVVTTFGYQWLDEHLGADGRLRGDWSGSDGAAGRMTASGGLHNMPTEMRTAVVADAGHVFVRADLGQIEPRVLASVSGDAALAQATLDDDLYAQVAAQLEVDRATAKVAVLGAMYGQTTGHGAQALRRLQAAYPVAMAYLDGAARAGAARRDLRTYGGRAILMAAPPGEAAGTDAGGQAAARGRYGRNALIQGAAAELFKVWAVTVRARAGRSDARIVLCLHDELLVHVPAGRAEATVGLLDDGLREAAGRWAPGGSVRFVAQTSVVRRWSDAGLRPAGQDRS